ncbi:MAG: YbjN domain-containing protein [Oscillospiraceae bacterium]|nr:YbjN domain-containing protein [Oscillospiraceae bacterium]
MIYKATNLIATEFRNNGLKFATRELQNFSFLEAGFNGKNCSVTLRFISTDNDNDVKVLSEDFVKFPEGARERGFRLLNAMNRKYKYVKFTMDEKDGGVSAQFDFPLRLADAQVGPVAVEIALRFAKIVDDSYPEFMQGIWR